MSTRSIVARVDGDGFAGTYCHFDGYPTCRGEQLFAAFRELGESPQALRDYAIREGQNGYWSSFQTPSRAALEAVKPDKMECWICKGTGNRTDGVIPIAPGNCNGCSGTGQSRNSDKHDGWIVQDGPEWVTSSGDDMGTEWAYVIADHALFVFERRFGNPADDQGHGVGMFGMGASDTESGGYWTSVAECRWDEPEPNWEMVEEIANPSEVEA